MLQKLLLRLSGCQVKSFLEELGRMCYRTEGGFVPDSEKSGRDYTKKVVYDDRHPIGSFRDYTDYP